MTLTNNANKNARKKNDPLDAGTTMREFQFFDSIIIEKFI
jgi:hypothetical protein